MEQPTDRAQRETHSRPGCRNPGRDRSQIRRRHLRRETQPICRSNPRRPRARPTERQSHFFNPGWRHAHRRHRTFPVEAFPNTQDIPIGGQARERRLHGVARSVKVANRHITGHLANRGSGRPPKRRCVTRETLERDRWTVDSGRRRNDAGGVRRITQQPPSQASRAGVSRGTANPSAPRRPSTCKRG